MLHHEDFAALRVDTLHPLCVKNATLWTVLTRKRANLWGIWMFPLTSWTNKVQIL